MPKKKIAILGTAPTWKDAPFRKPDWEIWTANRYGLRQKPWDRLFEIHQNWDYESVEAKEQYLADLEAVKPPQQVISIVPLGARVSNFVLDREKLFEKYGRIWFSSTFGYMCAWALEQKPTDIGFYGVDLEAKEEYIVQFAAVRHFIDLMKERGITVHIPDRSSLRRDPCAYADRFETVLAYTLESKVEHLQKLMRAWTKEVEHRRVQVYVTINEGYSSDDEAEGISDKDFDLREAQSNLDNIKGQLHAIRAIQRMFVFNSVLPDIGEFMNDYDPSLDK